MSLQPNIQIHTEDIKKIMDAIESKRMNNSTVKIVDNGNQYVIRDSGGFVITYVEKKTVLEDTGG